MNPTSRTLLTPFVNALDNFSCPEAKAGSLVNASWLDQVIYCFSGSACAGRDYDIMSIGVDMLRNAERVSPRKAFKGREVHILREWLGRSELMKRYKKLSPEQQKDIYWDTVRRFKTELTAYRLGITSENLNASKGLESFSETKAYLPNYLSFYRHNLICDSPTSAVKILMDGVYTEWATAKEKIVDQPDVPGIRVPGLKEPTKWPWKYGKNGLQNQDLFVWDEKDLIERSYFREKYAKLGKFIFSYCVFRAGNGPRMFNDHSWVRLITPEGNVYEFGKYRPPEIKGRKTALVKHAAVIQSPDCSTMWPVPPKKKRQGDNPPLKHTDHTKRTKIDFEIDQQRFNKALGIILKMQREGGLQFGLFDESCAVFVNRIANECGIQFETRATILKLILPAKLIPIVDRITKYIPELFFKILYFIPGLFTNAFCLFLGAWRMSHVDRKRHIGSLRDFLNPYKSVLHHPWYAATLVKKEVKESRSKGSYEIPAQFRLPYSS